jgi:hypothetical protein
VGAQAAKISGAAVAAAICKKVRRDSLDGWLFILFLLTSKQKGRVEQHYGMTTGKGSEKLWMGRSEGCVTDTPPEKKESPKPLGI